jgi:hypothetical protein
MGERRRELWGSVVAAGAVAMLFTIPGVAPATPSGAHGCAQFEALKGVFPKATAIGFSARTPVRREPLRAPIWPGTCAKWWASYRRGSASLDVSLTLYRTHKQVLVALAEPAAGPVERLGNGALVRTRDSIAWVDGVRKRAVGVVSVYRNVFIGSVSIAGEPVSLRSQMRLHRRIHAGVQARQ